MSGISQHFYLTGPLRYPTMKKNIIEGKPMKLLVIGIGGFLGAISRYELSQFIGSRFGTDFPLGTFVINISGAFILAFFMTLILNKFDIDPLWRLFFATGFLGAYTTFSTLEYETLSLTLDGQLWMAALNLFGSCIAGYIAVWLGNLTAKLI